jgi:hypothetical protein
MKKRQESEVYSEVTTQYELAKRYLDIIHQRMNQQEELYRTYLDPNNYPNKARVFDPRVFRVIETITPRMVANEPSGSFYPREQGDVAVSKIFSELIKYDWVKAEMFEKLVKFVKSMLIFGTAFGRVYWDYQEKDVKRMVPKKIGGQMIWTPKNTEDISVCIADNPNFEPLDIYDCFPDPNATNLKNMRWFIYRTYKTLEELEQENETRGQEYWKNLDKVKEILEDKKSKKVSGQSTTDQNWRQHRRTMIGTEQFIDQDVSNPTLTILHRFDRNGWTDVIQNCEGIVIRDIDNPYFNQELPIIYGVDYPYPGELYGMGEIEPVDRVQRAINAVLNQRLDNVNLTLNNMWKVRKGGGVDLHTLKSAPGNIIFTTDMTALEPVQVPDVTGSTFVETMNYLTSSLQNGTGVTDYTMGIDGNNNVANKTATGTRLVQQEANAQFKLKIQLLNHMVIERIANMWKDLRIQYTTEKQIMRILGRDVINDLRDNTQLSQTAIDGSPLVPGDERQAKLEISPDENFAFLTILPEDIQPYVVGDYDFIATVNQDQLSDPIAMQENFFTALDRVNNPLFVQGLAADKKQLNYEYLVQEVFDNLKLGLDSKKVIKDFVPPEQQMQQDQQSQPIDDQQFSDLVGNMPPDINQVAQQAITQGVQGGING